MAAGIAWAVAHNALGHARPFFAPIAATIVLGFAPGRRGRRAVEMVIGVAVGIGVGDLLIALIGSGAAQIALVVLLAMAAVLLGGGPLVASQAASSAVLVAALPSSHAIPTRFVDALVGGFVGLVVLAVVPRNPLTMLRRVTGPLFAELAGVLAVRNVRVLARAARTAVEQEALVPAGLPAAVRDLASGVRGFESELDRSHGGTEGVAAVLRAAGRATLVLDEAPSLPVSVIVGQIRSTAVDLLRALGIERADAVRYVRTAARRLQVEREAGASPPPSARPRRPF